jgi:hypothetical protein
MIDHTNGPVRESFDLVDPMASEVGALFCANLFNAHYDTVRAAPAR